MILSNGPQFWAGYFISLVWYVSPLVVLVMLLIILQHRHAKQGKGAHVTRPGKRPVWLPHSGPLAPASQEDHALLVRRCRLEMTLASAIGAALKRELILAGKQPHHPHTEFSSGIQSQPFNHMQMENLQEKLQGYENLVTSLQNKIDMLETMPASTGNEAHYLRELLAEKDKEAERLQACIRNLEEKNRQLVDERPENSTGDHAALVHQLREEAAELRQVIAERAYMPDMLEENKLQIDFLRNQLEQRIKSGKQLEQQLETLQAAYHTTGNQLLIAENAAAQLREQQVFSDSTIADLQDTINRLTRQLEDTLDDKRRMEEKTGYYRQVIRRISQELESATETWPEKEQEEALS